jgi:putative addiction module component (TIGR02574 family)
MDSSIDLRNKVLEYIQSADHQLLEMIQSLAESYQENKGEFELTSEQKKELDRRLERIENGETQFFTLEEIEARLDELK